MKKLKWEIIMNPETLDNITKRQKTNTVDKLHVYWDRRV